jgi:hypothetical protein
MFNNTYGRRTPLVLPWSGIMYAAGALTLGVAAGLWLLLAHGQGWQVLLPAAVVALAAIIGMAWQSRARAADRLHAALDAYARRELARARRRQAPTRGPALSAHRGVLPGQMDRRIRRPS